MNSVERIEDEDDSNPFGYIVLLVHKESMHLNLRTSEPDLKSRLVGCLTVVGNFSPGLVYR